MLPARYRLSRSSDIAETIRRGQRARRGGIVVHVLLRPHPPDANRNSDGLCREIDPAATPSLDSASQTAADGVADGRQAHVVAGGDGARAAFAVSKAVGGSAVRHRVVRRLRGLMPPILDQLPPDAWLVVRAMPEAATASSAELRRDLIAALTRVVPDFIPPPDKANAAPNVGISATETARSGRTSDAATLGQAAPTGAAPTDLAAPTGAAATDLAASTQRRTGLARIGWIIGTPFRWLLLGLIWAYRHTISPILPPTCRYHPSCSAYAFEALQTHGAAKGFVLATWRVLRCNPFTPGGLDPVPPRGQWRPDILPDGQPRTPARAA